MKHEVDNEKRQKIKEFNEQCRLKQMLESVNNAELVEESVAVLINGHLVDIPKRYTGNST
jgi:putative transposon-encoded protein